MGRTSLACSMLETKEAVYNLRGQTPEGFYGQNLAVKRNIEKQWSRLSFVREWTLHLKICTLQCCGSLEVEVAMS